MTAPAPSFLRRASAAVTRVRDELREAAVVRSATTWVRQQTPKAIAALGRARRELADSRAAHALANWIRDRLPADTRPLPAPPAELEKAPPDSALLLLGLLQKEGRLLDFLHEDIKSYSDQEVGAAARVVHQGCQRVLHDYLTIAPVRDEPEGSRLTLEPGFDAAAIRPTGNLIGDPPFTGRLAHRGWRVVETRLPQLASTHDLRILAPAEVEL